MNPLTNTKNQMKMNKRELELGMSNTVASWHYQFRQSAWVFIGGLNYDLTEGDVITVFSQYGEVVNLNLVRDKVTGKAKGFAFLCYENQQSTVLAVDNFNGIKLLGKTIRVDHVKDYKVPKDDEDDEDEVRKLVRREGCAPEVKVEKLSKKVNKALKSAKEEKDEHMNLQCNSVLKGNEEDWSEHALKMDERKGREGGGGDDDDDERSRSGTKRKSIQEKKDEIGDHGGLSVAIKEERDSNDEYGRNISEAINSVRKNKENNDRKKDGGGDEKSSKNAHSGCKSHKEYHDHHHKRKSSHNNDDDDDSDRERRKKESRKTEHRRHRRHHDSLSRKEGSSKRRDGRRDEDDRNDSKRSKNDNHEKDSKSYERSKNYEDIKKNSSKDNNRHNHKHENSSDRHKKR